MCPFCFIVHNTSSSFFIFIFSFCNAYIKAKKEKFDFETKMRHAPKEPPLREEVCSVINIYLFSSELLYSYDNLSKKLLFRPPLLKNWIFQIVFFHFFCIRKHANMKKTDRQTNDSFLISIDVLVRLVNLKPRFQEAVALSD